MESKFLKRILSTVLALSIVVPGGVLTAKAETNKNADPADVSQYVTERAKNLIEAKTDKLKKADAEQETVDQNKIVRVIVEFNTEPNQVALSRKGTGTLTKIKSEQAAFFTEINRTGIELTKLNNFKEVFNGVSAKIRLNDMAAIKKMAGVKNVYISQEYERPEPLMTESVGTIEAPFAWDLDYKGEGFVVGVIDSGFDTTHKDFILTNPENVKVKERNLIGKGLKGKYVNAKFPYGYNYYDENHILREEGQSHGQHVAGTVAANGDEVKGVAPEAQILALRVFSNDPLYATTFDDIYLAAIEDAVVLGADAVNLSLGSPAGFSSFMESALDQAVLNARQSGVVLAMSAGNERNLVEGWPKNAADWMPDQGVVGTPGLTPESFSIAATEKLPLLYSDQYVTYVTPDGPVNADVLVASSSPDPVDTLGSEPLEFVDAGDGSPQYFDGAEGKVAFVVRGGETPNFTDKLANAEAAGVSALVVYNNRVGDKVNMAGEPTVPYMFMDQADGEAILALPEGERTIRFGRTPVENPSIQMAQFSSWGSTPDLRLKPEIAAPGSAIYSLQNDNGYTSMSGTSMSSPHVAGAAAVVRDYMSKNEPFKSMSEGEKARLSKVLLMNSAYVMTNDLIARSPRVQGAGMMDLKNMIETKTLAYDPTTKEAKLELKEVTTNALDLDLTVENFGDEALTYVAEVILITDEIVDGHYTELSRNVEFELSGDTQLTVGAGAKASMKLDVTFDADAIASEQFVEGFIVLTDNKQRTTTVPFMGFYGDWNKPQILDNFASDVFDLGVLDLGMDPDGPSFFQASSMLTLASDFDGATGLYFVDNATDGPIWMNPGNPISIFLGTNNLIPRLTLLRNAEELKFSILDDHKESIFTIGTSEGHRKVNRLDRTDPMKFVPEGEWFGQVQDGYIPDGLYFYEIAGRINYEHAKVQTKQIPLLIDHTAPVVKNATIEKEDDKYFLSFEATDGPEDRSVGVSDFIVSTGLEGTENDIEFGANEDNVYVIDVTDLMAEVNVDEDGTAQLFIFAYDNLYNGGVTPVTYTIGEAGIPNIVINKPLDYSASTEVQVSGAVFGIEYLDTIEISSGANKVVAEPTFVEAGMVYDLDGNPYYYGPHWTYDEMITMEPGYTPVKVMARALDGSENSLNRYIYVDDGAPELTVEVEGLTERESETEVIYDTNSDKAVFNITMSDAHPYLRLLLNGEQIFLFDGASDGRTEKMMTHEVPLKMGENVFTFELMDISTFFVANPETTVKTVKINRGETMEGTLRISGNTRYKTAIEVSKTAFKTSDHVIVVDGETAVDSLLAGPLSVQMNAPILLVNRDGLSNDLISEIRRLGATKAVIIGGELAVPERAETELTKLGLDVTRLGGATRFETSVIVDLEVRKLSDVGNKAVIANGYTVFDALTAGAAAGEMGVGILFNDGKSVDMLQDALEGVTEAVVLGGELVENDTVVDALEAQGIAVERVFGSTRYATAVAIADKFYDNPENVIISNGVKPYDALAGTVLSSKYNAPMLITPAGELNNDTKMYIEKIHAKKAYVLGGTMAVSDSVRDAIEALLN